MTCRSQITLICNPSQSPFGINLLFSGHNLGLYCGFRSDFSEYSPGEWGLRDKEWIVYDMGGIPNGTYKDGGHDNYTVGVSLGTSINDMNALVVYSGITWDVKRIFEEYDVEYSAPYYAKSSTELSTGLNFGIILQTHNGLSYQIGYDFYPFPIKLDNMNGSFINFGIGFNWSAY